jgi:LPS-assembly protein
MRVIDHIARFDASAGLARPSSGGCLRHWTRHLTVVQAAAIAVTLAAIAPNPAHAQSQQPLEGIAAPKIDSGLPMLLQADEMIYDNQNNKVTARGNVEIYYSSYTLLADKVIYNQRNNTLAAEGNVRIKEPDGAVINADNITLTDDFRDGFIRSLKIVTSDDARIAASRATRVSGETTVFDQAVYTPCKPCEDDPSKPPTWRIKATKVIHKKSEATIEYKHARLEMKGVPVLYAPYFRHADPTVKRKSGFLFPDFSHSDNLGFTTETPYYFALAPNYDFTFSPLFSEKRGVLLKGKWRHRTENGRYSIEAAGINAWDKFEQGPGNKDFRGSIKSDGEFDINQIWSYGWDVTAETDDTFRRFYQLDNILTTERVSEINLTGIGDRSYFDARLYHFGALTFEDTATSEAIVHPVIDYNYIFSDPVLGGELAYNSNVLSLSSEDSADTNRYINELTWRRSMISQGGQVFTPFFAARGDLYKVSNVFDPVTGEGTNDDSTARGLVTGGLEYRYPFVAHGRIGSHVIEPIGQIIVRTNVDDQNEIPNQDARSLVFDDTLLFEVDKFSGYDRIEDGTRANAGLRYTLQGNNGGYLRAVVGQSYQIAGDNEFAFDSGLRSVRSDYVTGLYFQPGQMLGFVGQARFNEDNLDLQRTDITSNMRVGPLTGSVTYTSLRAQPSLGISEDREEILASSTVLLTDYWSLFGNMRFDIEDDQRITDAIGIKYSDDCFALSVSYTESFIRDRDITPDEKILVRFQFKHLGAFDVDAGPAG